MIRVAMLSFWHVHARDYAKQAVEHPDTEIVAAWDENPQRGREEAARYGVPFYENLDELLARDDVDAVIVDTPTSIHRDVMVAAAKAGKHIFTEKVLAATLQEANEIVRAVNDNGVKLFVSLRRLYNGPTVTIKQIIDEGLLGTVTLVRVRDAHNGAVGYEGNPRGWLVDHFFNKPETLGGAMIDLGCHPMYLTRYFAGLPDSVSGHYGYVTERAVEDNAVTILQYGNGALGVVETSFVSGLAPFTIEVYGTEGSLTFSATDNKVHVRSAKLGSDREAQATTRDPAPEPATAYEQWVSHIQQNTDASENTTLAIDLTRLMEASNLSAERHASVKLSELAS